MLLLMIIINGIQAQRLTITNDSLRNHFRRESPYEVFEYYLKGFDILIDYESLYYDEEMKSYLMKWLDEDEILADLLNRRRKTFNERFNYDKKEKISFTEDYIKEHKLNFDSICSDTTLLNMYTEMAISEFIDRNRDRYLKNKHVLLIDFGVLLFHARIVYPEAYKKVKQLWYNQNKQIVTKSQDFNTLFICLLKMNDPEAQSEFDKIIADFVKTNGESFDGTFLLANVVAVGNAYAKKKLIELLSVYKKFQFISDGADIPFDGRIYGMLRDLLKYNQIETTAFEISYKTPEEYIKEMRKQKENVVEATNRLIKKIEKSEEYWMVNMPFDYTPNTEVMGKYVKLGDECKKNE